MKRFLAVILASTLLLFIGLAPAFAQTGTGNPTTAPTAQPTQTTNGTGTSQNGTNGTNQNQVTPTQTQSTTTNNTSNNTANNTSSNTTSNATGTCANPYTVQTGDTFSGIAQNCNVTLAALTAANPSITNTALIFPGDKINIPQGGSIPTTGGVSSSNPNVYTIQTGDTLSGIAAKYNVTMAQLLAANTWVTNQDLIFPGQNVNLPAGASTTPTSSGPGIPATGGAGTYTVQTGDTLTAIAASHNTNVNAILTANPWIANRDLILPGWVISLP